MTLITKRCLTLPLSRVEKFASAGRRTVRGYASTDALDRQGDIVDPRGGVWELPLPCLWNHKHDAPIGWIRSIEVRPNGLFVSAEFAEGLGRADEIWAMVTAGLVTGFSVGFLPRKSEPLPGGGRKFTSWELIEISCVVIPAQPGAKIQRGASGAIQLISAGIPLLRADSYGRKGS